MKRRTKVVEEDQARLQLSIEYQTIITIGLIGVSKSESRISLTKL